MPSSNLLALLEASRPLHLLIIMFAVFILHIWYVHLCNIIDLGITLQILLHGVTSNLVHAKRKGGGKQLNDFNIECDIRTSK